MKKELVSHDLLDLLLSAQSANMNIRNNLTIVLSVWCCKQTFGYTNQKVYLRKVEIVPKSVNVRLVQQLSASLEKRKDLVLRRCTRSFVLFQNYINRIEDGLTMLACSFY